MNFIREFGFPIFVCVWFMWRIEKRLDRFYELLMGLMQATALLAKSVDDSVVEGNKDRTQQDSSIISEEKQ